MVKWGANIFISEFAICSHLNKFEKVKMKFFSLLPKSKTHTCKFTRARNGLKVFSRESATSTARDREKIHSAHASSRWRHQNQQKQQRNFKLIITRKSWMYVVSISGSFTRIGWPATHHVIEASIYLVTTFFGTHYNIEIVARFIALVVNISCIRSMLVRLLGAGR